MEDLFNAMFLVILTLCVVLLAWILSYYIRSKRLNMNTTKASAILLNSSCNISLDLLPDTSRLVCCRNNFYSDARYDPINNVVISSTSEYWVDGCRGFCQDNTVTPDGNRCLIDPENQNYINCISRNKPNGCQGLALPVGRRGTNYMYVVSAGNDLCPIDVQYIC